MQTQGQLLQKYYECYQGKKTQLSRRSFAKFLDIPAARLHDYLYDIRVMTPKLAMDICKRLKLSEQETSLFVKTVSTQNARKSKNKNKAVVRLSMDQFNKISDWYYFAILALVDTVDFQSNHEWISERLNLPLELAQEALTTLTDLGFLTFQDGRYSLQHVELETETDIPSESLRESHKQSLQRIIQEVDAVSPEHRDLQSVTFAGDPRRLKLAKNLIYKMTQRIVTYLETGKRSEVYELNTQLFPISKSAKSALLRENLHGKIK